ncbi:MULTISPECIES: aldehyde dehydrogenase [unclassified Novosphingobium]|uniref:aldehyde dehydrogenase n=1 Tax=unclassified Novosphingobium TaxID=2644732 RepID=UPI00086B7006|nr:MULTISPECIES: aldehyde dehydrogenase [unclassified Novosphingobium]MDR6707354.1 acyl-CoA reductase-like NAD-dependent aldehyde dehydrogenase [Novosphingobium sp. 1748]NKI98421.1 acyl-CoA reductase-like NAD-dependent aldehyde dehydrogenase [Novosphingobium sp. SG707]ODU83307.1 MAG: aldehyde dehydrogenase [Novosphingobium sp. SCN 63-17]OJX96423.1 MAG: aldehyde dehydrogenase [Novosphingobium sp. 63-713]
MLPHNIRIAHPDRIFIGGSWVASTGDLMLDIVSPDSEEIVAQVVDGTKADMDRAVAAARKAFDEGPWPTMPPAQRGAMLRRMGEELEKRHPELAAAWTWQVGGLASFAPIMTGGSTAQLMAIAGYADTFPFVEQRKGTQVDTVVIAHEPAGVCAAIAPWNAPYGILASKTAYALVAGCTVIMKPAPETPLEAYIMAEAAEAAGLPAGVVNMVAAGREASDHLVCNPGVDKVTFTGSTGAGKRIGEVCAGRIARCTLELGGKSAAIVRDDFPIEAAAAILGNTISVMSGQVCAMLSRAIVPRHRHDELADAIARVMQGIRVGHSHDMETQMGPLAMQRQLHRVEEYIALGRQSADLVTGGSRPSHLNKGYFLEPTLFANVDNASRIAQEEIFGPVLCLIPADSEEHAIAIANDSHYGLNGSVLTQDAEAAYRIARRIRSGGVGQNGMRMEFGQPFGGFKQSGIGREGGPEALGAFLETKTILLDAAPAVL